MAPAKSPFSELFKNALILFLYLKIKNLKIDGKNHTTKQVGRRSIFISLSNNRIALSNWLCGAFKVGSNVWVWSRGLLEVAWYATLHMGWPLESRGSGFPDRR